MRKVVKVTSNQITKSSTFMIYDAWNWYINLFHSSNPLVVLSAIGTTIVVLTFLIKFVFKPLYHKIKVTRSQLKVSAKIDVTHTLASLTGNQNISPSIICAIVNTGSENIYIRRPKLKIYKGLFRNNIVADIGNRNDYNKDLKPGQEITESYDLSNLRKQTIDKLEDRDKFTVQVSTTGEKKFKSNKILGKKIKSSFSEATVILPNN